ncbi:MAG: hypothetical protein VX278_15030 [Myxococcota bacterium]|nr:hypothetical protein [Myxococcota bacterium]
MLHSLFKKRTTTKRNILPKSKLNLVVLQEELSLSPKQVRYLKADLNNIVQRYLTEQAVQNRTDLSFDTVAEESGLPSETLTITISL